MKLFCNHVSPSTVSNHEYKLILKIVNARSDMFNISSNQLNR